MEEQLLNTLPTVSLFSHFQQAIFVSTSREHKVNCTFLIFYIHLHQLPLLLYFSQNRALSSELPLMLVIISLDPVLNFSETLLHQLSYFYLLTFSISLPQICSKLSIFTKMSLAPLQATSQSSSFFFNRVPQQIFSPLLMSL